MPELKKWRQEDQELEALLSYATSKLVWATRGSLPGNWQEPEKAQCVRTLAVCVCMSIGIQISAPMQKAGHGCVCVEP